MYTVTQDQKGYKGLGMDGWIANWYTRTTRKDLSEFQTLARRIAADLPAESKILEVAPGPGFLSVELAKLGLDVCGLDISRTFVEIARQYADSEGVTVDFRQGNASSMGFASDRFDLVICRAAFKNFSEPLAALKEMRRVLKPGGRALIIDLRKDTPMESIDAYVDGLHLSAPSRLFTKLTFKTMLLKRAYTTEAFQKLVAQSGFSKSSVMEKDLGFEAWLEK